MRIAVVGGGPGGLYFAALSKQLDPSHEITVWERNADDDTFGFGVVFSDETLGGIEHADPAIHEAMSREFARWDDIDIHYRGEVITSGGHGFAAMSRKRLLEILHARCLEPRRDAALQHRGTIRRRARRDARPRGRRGRGEFDHAHALRGNLPADSRRAPLQIHVARDRPRVRRLQVLHRRDAPRHHADPRVSVRRHGQHVHRRDERCGLAACGFRGTRRARVRSGGERPREYRRDPAPLPPDP